MFKKFYFVIFLGFFGVLGLILFLRKFYVFCSMNIGYVGICFGILLFCFEENGVLEERDFEF